jgi:hypothetical protein
MEINYSVILFIRKMFNKLHQFVHCIRIYNLSCIVIHNGLTHTSGNLNLLYHTNTSVISPFFSVLLPYAIWFDIHYSVAKIYNNVSIHRWLGRRSDYASFDHPSKSISQHWKFWKSNFLE